MIVLIPVILWYRMPILGHPGQRMFLILRGFCGAIELSASYAAFRMIPFPDALTIVSANPIFVYIIGCVVMREECGIFQTLTVMVTMMGVVLISKPSLLLGQEHDLNVTDDIFSETRVAGTMTALSSCLMMGTAFFVIRKLKDCPPPLVVNAYSMCSIMAASSVIFIAHTFFQEDGLGKEWGQVVIPTSGHDIGLLLANGVFAVMGQTLLTLALRMEEASLVSLGRTIEVVMAFVFPMIWLPDQVIPWTSFVGALIVCSCVSLAALRKWMRDKDVKCKLWLLMWHPPKCGTERDECTLNAVE